MQEIITDLIPGAGNWLPLVIAIAVAVVSVLNAITKHWSQLTGLAKVVAFITEILSVFTSKGTSTSVGKLKLPLISVKPKE